MLQTEEILESLMREGRIALAEILPNGTMRSINAQHIESMPETPSIKAPSDSWLQKCQEMEDEFEPLHKFLETWGANCGASRDTFRGHIVKMLSECMETVIDTKEAKEGPSVPGADLLLAYRYLYYCQAVSMVPDSAYDAMERAMRDRLPKSHPIHKVGSDNPNDYDPAVRALGLYVRLRFSKLAVAPAPEEDEFGCVEPEPEPVKTPRRPKAKIATTEETGTLL